MVNYLIVPVPYLIFWFWFNQILSGGGGGGGGGGGLSFWGRGGGGNWILREIGENYILRYSNIFDIAESVTQNDYDPI